MLLQILLKQSMNKTIIKLSLPPIRDCKILDPTLRSRMFEGSLLFLTVMTSAQVWGWYLAPGQERGGSSAPGEEERWSWAPGGGLWGPWHREKGGRDDIIINGSLSISEGAVFQAILRSLKRLSKLRILTLAEQFQK